MNDLIRETVDHMSNILRNLDPICQKMYDDVHSLTTEELILIRQTLAVTVGSIEVMKLNLHREPIQESTKKRIEELKSRHGI